MQELPKHDFQKLKIWLYGSKVRMCPRFIEIINKETSVMVRLVENTGGREGFVVAEEKLA